jgi:hypothetical protein
VKTKRVVVTPYAKDKKPILELVYIAETVAGDEIPDADIEKDALAQLGVKSAKKVLITVESDE